jgi:cysteinyl-tRNA synthetase
MFSFLKKIATPKPKSIDSDAPVFLYNTLSAKKKSFVPLRAGVATLYSCGPTVYSRAHIGNLRAYVFSDVLARTLTAAKYHVRRVINITDAGHLVSDADEGEDKMELGAKREGTTAEAIASRYTDLFKQDLRLLGIPTGDIIFPKATEYIKEQIAMIKDLEKKGHTYRIADGVYFDTSTFPDYGKLGHIPQEHIKEGSAASLANRVSLAGKGARIATNVQKRNPSDFALWRFSPPTATRQQEWASPWGLGFPGWHIECSAMVRALLGETIDIHTGGIDHIPVHHNNEIAQSECVLGHPFVHYWMHGAFMNVEGEKVSKSLGNDVYLSDITEQGIHPLALRYLFLQAHYRSPISFSWESLTAANEALHRLWKAVAEIHVQSKGVAVPSNASRRIITILRDDLSTPAALAFLWEVIRDENFTAKEAEAVIQIADEVLGLSLMTPPEAPKPLTFAELPQHVQELVQKRESARKDRDFAASDELRIHIQNSGYRVEDGPSGPVFTKSA